MVNGDRGNVDEVNPTRKYVDDDDFYDLTQQEFKSAEFLCEIQ